MNTSHSARGLVSGFRRILVFGLLFCCLHLLALPSQSGAAVPSAGSGQAAVVAIEPCPPIGPSGEGRRPVIGRFVHQNAEVLDLLIEGEEKPIGVTPVHPIWCENRQAFILAGELRTGDEVQTLSGTAKVLSLTQRPGRHTVYNLEVQGDHVYRVGASGVLVHNSKPAIEWPPNGGFLEGPFDATLRPGARIDRYGFDKGFSVSPQGVPFGMRSLPQSYYTNRPYRVFEVIEPIPVKSGPATPWFGQPGYGQQYNLPVTVQELIDDGSLRPVPLR